MRKLFTFDMTSLDGYFASPDGGLDWHNVDAEFNDFAARQLDEIGTLLFGRITYAMMAGFWPTTAALNDDPIIAGKMNDMPKVVASHTLKSADWANTTLISDNIEKAVSELKNRPGKDIAVFGSSNLSVSLLQAGLVDECRLMVAPVFLGRGRSLFAGLESNLPSKLISTREFRSGNVLMCYEPQRRNPSS